MSARLLGNVPHTLLGAKLHVYDVHLFRVVLFIIAKRTKEKFYMKLEQL